ncbi:Similar to X-element\ORF2: Probable RNA-directed DNA polymerase from transposon X-element (Drosophila melanogaster) [Cotesia congregata]|uniref:Similar to X-element\ORF2: Probable RNA-directed DNA polymerase from transposon X-element (Drosophila melanogaster) n=1 Tax=Cotesia congregata TaxID=51543 RepID=A0A8J2MDD3_COTCN|nr:Similar to X-element\ORF2: Probable RNA-directed DNA polymerase from transposon X-element (Drosophila melanogaster) [Cotesia congregata]
MSSNQTVKYPLKVSTPTSNRGRKSNVEALARFGNQTSSKSIEKYINTPGKRKLSTTSFSVEEKQEDPLDSSKKLKTSVSQLQTVETVAMDTPEFGEVTDFKGMLSCVSTLLNRMEVKLLENGNALRKELTDFQTKNKEEIQALQTQITANEKEWRSDKEYLVNRLERMEGSIKEFHTKTNVSRNVVVEEKNIPNRRLEQFFRMSERLEHQERKEKELNLIIKGPTWEAGKEFECVRSFFLERFELDSVIDTVKVIGINRNVLVIRMSNLEAKKTILKNKGCLKGTTINVEGDRTREELIVQHEIRQEGRKAREEGITETWKTEPTRLHSFFETNYHKIWSKANKEHILGRPSGGLLLLISKKLPEPQVVEITQHWIIIELIKGQNRVVIGLCYFRPSMALNTILVPFQETISATEESFDSNIFIIGGDFNAHIAEENILPEELCSDSQLESHRLSNDKKLDARGKEFLNFMEENGLIVINGRTKSDTPARSTFTNCQNSVIDLFWVKIDSIHKITDLQVVYITSKSDHYPVKITSAFNLNTQILREGTRIVNKTNKIIWSENKAVEYKRSKAVLEVAENLDCLRTVNHRSIATNTEPWFDDECRKAKNLLNRALRVRKKIVKQCKPYDTTVQALRANFQKVTKKQRKAYITKIKKSLSNTRNGPDFWKVVKSLRQKNYSSPVISLKTWTEYLTKIYPPRISDSTLYYGVTHPYLDREINYKELDHCLTKLKNGKAPGEDTILSEHLKHLPSNWKLYIIVFFNKVLDQEITPRDWSSTFFTLLHKKGDPTAPENYRSIALTNNISKLFTTILRERLYSWAEQAAIIPESQAEVVSSCTYLGVVFSGSLHGRKAAESAISRAAIASSQTLNILAKGKADSWNTVCKLFDTTIATTLLYSAHLWGLRYHQMLEKAQENFFKRLFLLPRCTPGYALRLELGLTLVKLHKLSLGENCDPKYNWAAQFYQILKETGHEDLWENLSSQTWKDREYRLFKNYAEKLRKEDIAKWTASTFCQCRHTYGPKLEPAKYIKARCPINWLRMSINLRLANNFKLRLKHESNVCTFDPNIQCMSCNNRNYENVQHVLVECPTYTPFRNKFLFTATADENAKEKTVPECLDLHTKGDLKNLYYYMSNVLAVLYLCDDYQDP